MTKGSHTPEQIPKTDELEWKPKFVERYSLLTDLEEFKKYSLAWIRKGIRVNTLKISVAELKKRLEKEWNLIPVPWCKEGFWIDHRGKGEEKRYDIGNLIEHSLGYIYVQEPASMLPPVVLDPQPREVILDMAAAPGSKTTQIGMYMENKGVLVANDITSDRLASLGINLQRCGVRNAVITKTYGQKVKGEYDRILVDAPCSGTGTIRKSLKTLMIWNPDMVVRLSQTQKKMLQHAWSLVKPGGTVVYSTCTMEPEEDEGVVSWFLENNKDAEIQDIKLDIKRSEPVKEFNGVKFHPDVKKCLRIWPQDNDTEGFFVCKIRKNSKN
jgi:tRNA (cytosine49-C5)-methyltransferase